MMIVIIIIIMYAYLEEMRFIMYLITSKTDTVIFALTLLSPIQ